MSERTELTNIIGRLHRTRLLTARGVAGALQARLMTGANLMSLLRMAAGLHPDRTAVVDERGSITYHDLWAHSEALARALQADYGVQPGQTVALLCRNDISAVNALFALCRLGTDVVLINPDVPQEQLRVLDGQLRFDFGLYDADATTGSTGISSRATWVPLRNSIDAANRRLVSKTGGRRVRLPRVGAGSLVLLTSGTTGRPKPVRRTHRPMDVMPAFAALLADVRLDEYRRVYIATPIHHGFGLAALLTGVVLGAEMHFTDRFDAQQSCRLIACHKIEVVTLVPLMLQRMLKVDAGALSTLRCVMSGGSALSPTLIRDSTAVLGPRLFNLYGTSEGGYALLATPDQLATKPESVGTPVRGARVRIANDEGLELGRHDVGRLCVRSAWTARKNTWVDTGDLAYRDADGAYFLCGRADDMVVSGGENVYPIELENVLVTHPDVAGAAVVGIPDAEFGQRLKAVVALRDGGSLGQDELLEWLRPRVARHQMPAVIEFRDELPHTSLGKLDRLAL